MSRNCGLVLLLLATAPPPVASAQRIDTVAAGVRYRAGWFHRLFLGTHHRALWTAPVAVEVLDIDRYAGGLTPTRCGGQRQTQSLRFLGADGREYVFRPVDKDPTMALPPDLRQTFVRSIIQDQISSAHPGAPLVVAPLLDATQVLHASPHIMVLPADARLSNFPCARPGTLGMLEERPAEPPDNDVGFAGAADLASTKKLLDLLESDAAHRVDSRAFLAARLMDVFIGDWDRHHDQWRWARFDEGTPPIHWWRPIPRDRDQAFSRMDGILVWLAGFYQPQVVGFGDDYPPIWRLTYSGRVVDRRFLVDLERPTWDSIALALQARLTDTVIDAAVRSLPPAYYERSGAAMTRALRQRRDRLPDEARRFYALLAEDVEVHGTDRRDVAVVDRGSGGRMTVQLSRDGAPFYRRTFDARETNEVRLFLHGADDRLLVRGAAGGGGPVLRVIGGGGDDELVDSAQTGSNRFYDDRGQNRFVRGPHTTVDQRRYDAPPPDSLTLTRPRDWGSLWSPTAWVSYGPDLGAFVGGGITRTRYGFRRLPFASRVHVRAGYATAAQTYRAEFTGEFHGVLPTRTVLSLRARASGIEILHFYGFGNATVDTGSLEFHKVIQRQYQVAPVVDVALNTVSHFTAGPVFKFADTRLKTGTLIDAARPYGTTSFSQLGAAMDVSVDTRDLAAAARRGVVVQAGGSVYPAVFDVATTFGEAHAEARAYVSARVPLAPTLALRVGGKKVWGTYPLHEAAYLGGWSTLRGFPDQRFGGDAALFGSVELRMSVTHFYALVPGELGVFGLGDGGRVFLAGESSDRWHAAAGGGVWMSFLNRANTVSLAAADGGDGVRFYARAGFAF